MYRACKLCPHECGVDRTIGQLGVCGATSQMKAGRAALHWWEEPPLVGDRGSGAIFFSHCSLGCVYCQNFDLAHGLGIALTEEELVKTMLRLQNEEQAANINLVTPIHYAPSVAASLRHAKNAGLSIPVIANISGYESISALKLFNGLVDIYLVDFKYSDNALARKMSHAPRYAEIALAAIEKMIRQVGVPVYDEEGYLRRGVLIRHMILPGYGEQSCHALEMLWGRFGEDVLYSIMNQYTPLRPEAVRVDAALARRVTEEEYEAVLNYADELGMEYFWQQEGAAQESFVPAFDGTGLVSCGAQ